MKKIIILALLFLIALTIVGCNLNEGKINQEEYVDEYIDLLLSQKFDDFDQMNLVNTYEIESDSYGKINTLNILDVNFSSLENYFEYIYTESEQNVNILDILLSENKLENLNYKNLVGEYNYSKITTTSLSSEYGDYKEDEVNLEKMELRRVEIFGGLEVEITSIEQKTINQVKSILKSLVSDGLNVKKKEVKNDVTYTLELRITKENSEKILDNVIKFFTSLGLSDLGIDLPEIADGLIWLETVFNNNKIVTFAQKTSGNIILQDELVSLNSVSVLNTLSDESLIPDLELLKHIKEISGH